MSNFTPSNQVLNASNQTRIFILYVPLQPNKYSFLARYFYPLKGVIYRLAGSAKLATICSMWRVQL